VRWHTDAGQVGGDDGGFTLTLKALMKLNRAVQSLLLSITLATSMAAQTQVQFSIQVGPPEPLFETMPPLPAGYAWAPGYWAWNHDRHIWMRGRTIVQRIGYRWQPDRWKQRGDSYYRQPGNWARDPLLQAPAGRQAQRAAPGQYTPRARDNPRRSPAAHGPRDENQGNRRR